MVLSLFVLTSAQYEMRPLKVVDTGRVHVFKGLEVFFNARSICHTVVIT